MVARGPRGVALDARLVLGDVPMSFPPAHRPYEDDVHAKEVR
jgi:hypothetical protein